MILCVILNYCTIYNNSQVNIRGTTRFINNNKNIYRYY